jgi:glycosyltransferase involved in cell wall biosynthesis
MTRDGKVSKYLAVTDRFSRSGLSFSGHTMTTPLISVIIPVYNCVEYLQKALASVLDQNGVSVEVIVVDSSRDNSCTILSRQSEPRVRYVYQEPRGVSAARNLGIQHAQGEFIAFQDADDEWLPEKLKMQMSAFDRYPDTGLVFTDTMMFRDEGVIQETMNGHMLRDWCRSHASDEPDCYYGRLYEQLLIRDCMNTSSVLVRRKVLEEHGTFDENFKVGEDYDLWLRIARNHPMIFLDRVLCKYRVRDDGLSGGEEVRGLRWLDAHIAVREKHRQLNWVPTEHVGLLNEILSQRCWEAGWNYFGRNQLREARQYFWMALRAQPFGLRTWLYWCSSFMPEQAVEAIRSIRQANKKPPNDAPYARH